MELKSHHVCVCVIIMDLCKRPLLFFSAIGVETGESRLSNVCGRGGGSVIGLGGEGMCLCLLSIQKRVLIEVI